MGVAGKLRELRWRAAGHYTRPLPPAFTEPLRGAAALEIGGPSAVFGAGGLVPAYPVCARIDGVQWAESTLWHGAQSGAYAPQGTPTGVVHLVDGGTLEGVPDGSYDAVLSSHVIEHLANPLAALDHWRRVCRPGAVVLLVAPHMEGTFDHRRAVTPLAHMVEDRERGTGEDDLTHLDETLRLHDRSRDGDTADRAAWERQRRENLDHRVLHHHVFTTASLVELLVHAGVDIAAVQTRYPHDIYATGRFGAGSVDAGVIRGALRSSPFSSDRAAAWPPSASAPAAAR
jgi:SAM-dependent methyltransferase